MTDNPTASIEPADETAAPDAVEVFDADMLVDADVLVEEVSIDGMCGVY
jgi:mycofactocin precursor